MSPREVPEVRPEGPLKEGVSEGRGFRPKRRGPEVGLQRVYDEIGQKEVQRHAQQTRSVRMRVTNPCTGNSLS